MNETFGQLPPQHSTLAAHVDWMYMFLLWGSVAFFVVITALVIYFSIRYHRSRGHKASPTGHNQILEVTWTFAPIILLVFLFHEGFKGYTHSTTVPDNAITVRVRASQWRWEFEYPNGMKELGVMRVPIGHPIRLVMSSDDVLHSFFVPDFRVKKDVVPGSYTTLWFQATALSPEAPRPAGSPERAPDTNPEREGFQVFCSEYCGTSHAAMLAKVVVMPMGEWNRYMREGPARPEGMSNAQWGQSLYTQAGCNACHSTDGSPMPGPTWHNMVGTQIPLEGGTSVPADANFLRESILRPQASIVRGFTTVVMPPFAGSLSDRQIDALIDYMKCLSDSERGSVEGCPQ